MALSEETKGVLKTISDVAKLAGEIATVAGQPEVGAALVAGGPFLVLAAQMLGIKEVVKVESETLEGGIDFRTKPGP